MAVSFSFALDFLKDLSEHIRSYIFQYKTDNSGLLKPSLSHAAPLSKSISKKSEQEPVSDLVLRPTTLSAPPLRRMPHRVLPLRSQLQLTTRESSRAHTALEWAKQSTEKEPLWHSPRGRKLDKFICGSFPSLRQATFSLLHSLWLVRFFANCPLYICANKNR